jgi:hypothetical protein
MRQTRPLQTRPLQARAFIVAGLLALNMLAGSAFAADPGLLNLVMPDAQVLAGMNVTNSTISPLGTFLLSHLSNDPGLQQFIAQTGFDPSRDLTEMLAASNGNTAAPSSLVLAKGSFDVAKIVARIAQGTSQQVSTYAGATLITSTNAKDTHAAAFIGGSIAVTGNVVSVKAALDRSGGVNSIDPALAAQAQTLSTTEDAWSVSLASLGSLIPGGATAAGGAGQTLQLVKNIQSSSAGLKFGGNVQFTAQAVADTPQDASALGDVIKMIASLAAMSAASNADAAAIAQALQSLQVTTSGATVNLSASLPEAQVEALLSAALAPHAAVKTNKL